MTPPAPSGPLRTAAGRFGAALVLAAALLAIGGGALALCPGLFNSRCDPERVNLSFGAINQPPGSWPHLLGTDDQGRDCLARLAAGSVRTLGTSVGAVALSAAIGIPAGLLAGFFRGFGDRLLSRLTEIAMAFPALVLAIAIVTALGPSLASVAVAAGLTGAPSFMKLARGQVMVEAQREYVTAARALGLSPGRILARQIAPNVLAPLVALATLSLGTSILEIAGLGFLGLGVAPGVPEWGTDVSLARNQFLTAPWTILVPGAAISASVLGFNLLGDALQKRPRGG